MADTPRRALTEVLLAATAVETIPKAALRQGGLRLGRPFRTLPPKCRHSRQSAKPLRLEQQGNRTFEMYSCATHGTTDRGPQKSCTICSCALA
jgi:hypothetical protein